MVGELSSMALQVGRNSALYPLDRCIERQKTAYWLGLIELS
jgi:hypothetical protein